MEIQANGYVTYYHSNGNKMFEGEFRNGVKIGKFKYYDLNGKLVTEITYSDDAITGDVNCFNNKGQLTVKYDYSGGSIQGSTEYLNEVRYGEYRYGGATDYEISGAGSPPPINTIFHAFDDKHPSEIFPGTLWTFLENSYKVDDTGVTKPVSLWLREPNVSRGPYIYVGEFTEYRNDGTLFRSGSYVRSDDESGSSIHGTLNTYRENGSILLFKGEYNKGVKTNKLEYYDTLNRVWKSVNIGDGTKLYNDGYYVVFDVFDNGKITYTFDQTNSAHLTIHK